MHLKHTTAIVLSLISVVAPSSMHSQSFTRVTTGAFVNDVGAFRSVNWVDVNNDGFLDLFVSTGREGGENDVLYVNNGPDSSFTFRKITGSPIVSDQMPSDGSSWGDIDNDGDLDAVVVAWYDSVNFFYTNSGAGTFAPVTSSPIFTDRGYSETCSWGDYDNDGYLDLYVSNSGGNLRNFIYHSNGNGTFTRITTGSIALDAYKSRGVNWVDYDNDGDMDMFITNESNQANNLYRNELKETGTATFTRITTGGIVTDISSSWSGSWADYDNDGDQDVFIATGYPLAANDMLYKNNGNATFTRILAGPPVTDAARSACGAWGDVDNDGDLDLFVTTAYATTASKNFLYMNRLMETGSPTFEQVTTGTIVNDLGSSYGVAWGDYDNDGDLDLFVAKTTNEAATNAFYRNDNAIANHWIEFRCVGDSSNRSGIGAKVRFKATINGNPVWQERVVEGQSGYCAQNLVLHFGLGNATVIDTLKVLWPSGIIDIFTNVTPNRIAVLREGGAISGVLHVPSGYSTIQAAINASVNGDTVLVAPGTYPENIVFRGKRIVVTSHYAIGADPSYIPATVIDGSNPSHPDSGSVVRIVNGEDSSAVLQGFTLTGGHGTLWADEHGLPSRYWEGGGILIALSSPTIRHNIIRNNNVNRTGGTSTGGGGIRLGDGAPHILNNIITNNAGMYGGGLVSNYAAPIVRNNIIAYNVVSPAVVGLPTYGGGGLWFNGNVQGNRIENNTIVGNSATGTGGGGAGGRGGGMIAVFGATITTRNNIIWGNTQTAGGQLAAPGSIANVSYSDVEGGFAGTGNINQNPVFSDSSFYLGLGSPCIDAGDTAVAFNDREDAGNPGSALWPSRGLLRNDMGAYGGPGAAILNGFLTSAPAAGGELTPGAFVLSQNYPNPFNPNTKINYGIKESGFVSLKVYDLLGREMTTLVSEQQTPGSYSVTWNAGSAASGVYMYTLKAGDVSETRRMIVVK